MHAFGWLDELDARAVEDDFLFHIADAAVGDAAFDDDRSVAERQAEFVKGIEMEGEAGFDGQPPRPISLIAIGWKTITSPCSSPRIWMRSASRLLGRRASPSGGDYTIFSIHPERGLGDRDRKHLHVRRLDLLRRRPLTLVFASCR